MEFQKLADLIKDQSEKIDNMLSSVKVPARSHSPSCYNQTGADNDDTVVKASLTSKELDEKCQISPAFELTRENNIELRKIIARTILDVIAENKEIDKMCSLIPANLTTKRPRYEEHAYILYVLREADKLMMRKKEDEKFNSLPWHKRAGLYISKNLKKSSQR